MSSLFFWIIILSFVVPMAMRMYRKSVAKRNYDQSFPGRYPDQFPGSGQYPGQYGPGQYGSSGPQSRQPRDGYTQQDYFSGGFRQIGQQGSDTPPVAPTQYGQPPVPPVPGQGGQPYGQQYGPQGFNQPTYNQPNYNQPSYNQQQPGQPRPEQPAAPATPPPPSAPQGFRARKLAELDQQYSNGELSMEDYMARRSEIMNG